MSEMSEMSEMIDPLRSVSPVSSVSTLSNQGTYLNKNNFIYTTDIYKKLFLCETVNDIISLLKNNKLFFDDLNTYKDKNKNNIIHIAIKEGNILLAAYFFSLFPVMNVPEIISEISPFKIGYNREESPVYDIRYSRKNMYGTTYLHFLYFEVAKLIDSLDFEKAIKFLAFGMTLIERGANQYILDNRGKSPIDFIKRKLHFNDSNGNTLLHVAISLCEISLAKYLIDYGANINAVNNYGNSIMHITCYTACNNFDNIEIFSLLNLLLRKGVRNDTKNCHGMTAGTYLQKAF